MRPLVRRRSLRVALLIAGLLAGWVASAGADLPPLPPVPPVPSVPTLPVLPPPPRPPQVPPAPAPRPPALPPVSHPSLPVGGGGGGATATVGGNAHAPSNTAETPAAQSSSRPAKVYRLHFSRDWISRRGPKQRRQTTLIFVLRKPSLVEFVVVQVAPDCRQVGRFRVRGRSGMNRVGFRGRIGRRVLGPGTYRITARALPGHRTVVDTRFVIVTRPSEDEIAAARSADTCGSGAGRASSITGSASGTPRSEESRGAKTAPGQAEKQARSPRGHGVLGARFTKAVDAVQSIPLWLFPLLGLAIALLAVAALPLRAAPNGRTAAVLAHRRRMIALAGAAVLVAVTVAYALH